MTDYPVNSCTNTHCVKTPAKINLGLSIVGRRADGYHLLESLFWPVSLQDELEITCGKKVGVELGWAEDAPVKTELPSSGQELTGRALALLGASLPGQVMSVKIKKRIPIGGGLGGGSSNAGAVIKARIEHGDLSRSYALETALAIGCDVPFFLDPRPAWVTGVGEKIEPIQVSGDILSGMKLLLVTLPKPTSTRDVFTELARSGGPFAKNLDRCTLDPLTWEKLTDYLHQSGNQLEAPAAKVYPLIGETLAVLRQTKCIYAGLSGSGSTCFALFRDESERRQTLKDLQQFCRKYYCRSLMAETFV